MGATSPGRYFSVSRNARERYFLRVATRDACRDAMVTCDQVFLAKSTNSYVRYLLFFNEKLDRVRDQVVVVIELIK